MNEQVDVLFIRSFTPDFDGRFNKYRAALDNAKMSWHFLGWDRSGKFISQYEDRSTFFRKVALTGGGWKNILNILYWNMYIFFFLLKNKKNIKVVHVIDFDSAFIGWPIAKLLRKKIIFDVYDKYTSARKFPSNLSYIIDKIENKYMEHSNYVFLVDEARIKQHNLTYVENVEIFENIPTITQIDINKVINEKKIRIGYVGIFEKEVRGLENLLEIVAESDRFEFHIAGMGSIEAIIKEYADQYSENIFYYGAVEHKKGMEIMANMDIALGLYYKTIPNHLYASPNKYYEHLMLGQPLITTKGTPPGEKVLKYQTGWAIEDSKNDLYSVLQSMSQQEILLYSQNAKKTWNIQYAHYLENRYYKDYVKIINTLLVN